MKFDVDRADVVGRGAVAVVDAGVDGFVEVALVDRLGDGGHSAEERGGGEDRTGRRGHHGSGGYFRLDDETAVDDILESLVREVWSWRG